MKNGGELDKSSKQKMPVALSTRVKEILNSLLAPVGLEVSTTLARRLESARLQRLQGKRHWEAPHYNTALLFDDERCLEFLRTTCVPFKTDYLGFSPQGNGSAQFHLQNGWFDAVDAEVLYSVIRKLKPRHIFEVGSGYSTKLMRKAIDDGRLATKITSVDPGPNTSLVSVADEYRKHPIEEMQASDIAGSLGADDILFIDSSHTVKTGGDVPFLFLEVLPRLEPGVFIHVHDIFFPFDYPARWVLEGWGWNEQYLVHAFLAYNETFEILWPASYMWAQHRGEIEKVIPAGQETMPSSLWLRKKL
jgi:hypothetical protein